MMPARRTGRTCRVALLAASLLVSGCAAQVKSDVSPDLLAADQKGVVVLHTNITGKCHGRGALYLSRFDAGENGWLRATSIPGPSFIRNEDDPLTEHTLKAGEYGIVEIACDGGMAHVHLVAQKAPNSGLLREVVSRPLAIFAVGAGEVVNIGTLEAVSTGPKSFSHRVTPIAPDLLARFQAAKPELAARMVTRLMTVPADPGNASFAVMSPAPK
jgi:hypothetical protein